MPWFTLRRNHVLSTTKGHSVNFVKGERTWVPVGIVAEAMGIGAIPENEIDVLPADKPEQKALAADEREKMVFAVFEKLLLRAGRNDFMASGQPHPKRLEEMLGFELTVKEREAYWKSYNTMKAEEANQ
jgi:hypothetical protein